MASRDDTIPYGPGGDPWKCTVSPVAVDELGAYLIEPPSEDPIETYPKTMVVENEGQKELQEALYQVPSGGIPDIQTIERAKTLALERNQKFQADFLGFQANQAFDYSDLNGFMKICTNNIGDPFRESSKKTNTRWIERNVLDYYASLWNIRWPHNPYEDDSYWGYCLTMGSTEGNMYSMWNARDYVTGKAIMIDDRPDGPTPYSLVQCKLKNADTRSPKVADRILRPVAFYSLDTHYSLAKTVALLQISTFSQLVQTEYSRDPSPLSGNRGWPEFVPSNPDGTISGDDLAALVGFFAEKGHPIIVLFNYGTVFKGAYDDVGNVGQKVLDTIEERTGSLYNKFDGPDGSFKREKYWIHVDGALGASYMPFYKMGVGHGLITPPKGTHFPEFDFKLPFVSSIVTSSHKWIGAPWPCGVYLTRTRLMLKPPSKPGYIASHDTTFAGSRNAVSPLLIWSHISTHDYETEAKRLNKCLQVAEFAKRKLIDLGKKLQIDLLVEKSPLSLAVVFKKPHTSIVNEFSISTDTYNGVKLAHIFVMEHVTEALIERFIAALESHPDPFPAEPEHIVPHVSKAPAHKQSFQRLMPWGFGGGGLF